MANNEEGNESVAATSAGAGDDAALRATVAATVARLRVNSGYDVAELARRSGVPADLLASIEAARATPSLRALWALARVFDVPFRLLIAGNRFADDVFCALPRDRGRTVVSAGGAFRSRSLSASGDPREPEVYEVTLEAGCVEEAAGHPSDTFEHVVVTKGRLRILAGDGDVELGEGDALFFRADVAHVYRNEGPGECRAILTVTNGGDWVVSA